jgi:four helix bundle protein
MKESILKDKSFNFALRIIKLSQHLQNDKKDFVLSKQILRSGTSVGAMICEAEQAESKADFIHKMAISQKEVNETIYWIKLLYAAKYITQQQYESMYDDAVEIMKILTASIKTAKLTINH